MKIASYEVPFRNLQWQTNFIREEVIAKFREVMTSGDYLGAESPSSVSDFESSFGQFVDSQYNVSVSNGTAALEIALQSLQIEAGGDVVTVGNTFAATISSIVRSGLTPKFASIDQKSGLMDLERLERFISKKTKAVLPVHLYGDMVDMPRLLEIAQAFGLPVIEDCAHAMGTRFKGRHSGTFGDFGAFSFYAGKNLGAIGEGGMLVTSDPKLAERARALSSHGTVKGQIGEIIGTNARLGTLEAITLRTKLEYLEDWNAKRRSLAEVYKKTLPPGVIGLCPSNYITHSYHVFVIKLLNYDRNRFISGMADRGIECRVHYPNAVFDHQGFGHLCAVTDRIVVEETRKFMSEIVSLPMDPSLSNDEVMRVCEAVKDLVA